MKPTIDQYKATSTAREIKNTHYHRGHLEVIKQAAVSVENLTGHAQWDRFLSYLQASMDDAKGQEASLKTVLANPFTVNHDEMMRTKLPM